MNTVLYIVLSSVFCNVYRINARTPIPINLAFELHTNKNYVINDRSTNINSVETIPNLINVDETANAINFRSDNRDLKFTDFILEAAMILKTYENKLLKEVFAILDDELGKSVYNGCKSHELVEVKGYLSDQLGVLKDTPAEILRDHLHNIIKILKKEDYGDLTETIGLVNSFYIGENDKFIKILLALMFKKISPSVNLADVLRRALRYLFFDHYCNLNDKIRRELILTIEHYWKQFANLRVKNKNDRSERKVKFVTPFDYVKRSKKSNKKKRFKTVSEGRPAITNKDDKSDSYEHKSAKNQQLLWPSGEVKDYLDGVHRASKKQGKVRLRTSNNAGDTIPNEIMPVITNTIKNEDIGDISFENNEINNNENQAVEYSATNKSKNEAVLRQQDLDKLKNIKALAEEIKGMVASEENNLWDGNGITDMPDEPKSETLLPNITLNLRPHNNTIGKILQIGTLAKEINDMMPSNKKILRQGGDAPDLQSLLWNLPLELVDGDISIIPQFSKTMKESNDNKDKDIVISMNVKYKK